ncbi:hypothetical protein [Nocardia nepalensis]|uniref:hypothetical protein n=1 Tax=Nocardia nepalensis TaxID=3375448 RepID=UPI003B681B14
MTAPRPARRSRRHTTGPGYIRPEKVIPTTIWAAGTEPIDAAHLWPTSIVARAVGEFSTAGDQILLLDWPTHPHEATGRCGSDITDALSHIQGFGRSVRILDPSVGDPAVVDLIITTQMPGHHNPDAGPRLMGFAATRLRAGGVLVVLTRCDWTHGVLNDPTGAIVADAQAADLLYLQHIAAVAIRGDAIVADTTTPTAAARRRGHDRVHTDVLVFTQPNDRDQQVLQLNPRTLP